MAIWGNVGAFEEEKENFADYADRFDAFLGANEIADGKKSNLLLATIGPDSFKLLKNLCSPDALIQSPTRSSLSFSRVIMTLNR